MARRKSKRRKERTISESLHEYGRGVAGGIMFSLPLLYTMEVWWTGFIVHPWRIAGYMLATYVLLLGYNRYGGLRHDPDLMAVAIDSVEVMGIGLIIAGLVLFLIGRVTLAMPMNEIAGLIGVEAMTVAVGVSVGTAQLGAGGTDDEGMGETSGKNEFHFGSQVIFAFCGAVLFAANVAPTEEIVILAVETSWVKLLGLAGLSLLLAFLILHYSDFKGARDFVRDDHPAIILLGTVATYAIALTSAAMILWFFGRFDGVTLFTALAQTLVLGVAATIGASAGRLLLQ